jgi:hypothetical protein
MLMVWAEVWLAIKFVFNSLPGEVDFGLLEQVAWQVFQAGWSKVAFLKAVLAAQATLFPDARTRPLLVGLLEALLALE